MRNHVTTTQDHVTYIPVQYDGAAEGLGYDIGSVVGGSDNGYAFVPQSYYLKYKNNNRLRKNLQNTFQIGTDNLTLTVDNTFSSVRFASDGSSWGYRCHMNIERSRDRKISDVFANDDKCSNTAIAKNTQDYMS